MPNRLSDLNVEFVSLVDRAAVRDPSNPTEPQKFLLWKAESGAGDTTPTEPQGGPMNPDELKAALAKAEQERDQAREAAQKAETERDAAKADLEKAQTPTEPAKPEADDLNKADLPDAVRARLEKAEADAAAANERIEKAEKLAKAEREIRVTREFVAKAESYRALVIKADEFGPVLKEAAEKLSKEAYDAIESVLKAADEQIAKGELFKEHGRGGDAQATSGGSDALVAKAAELRKSDSSLTEGQAMERAIAENPELARQHLDTVR